MSQLPLMTPMPLKVCREAFDDPAWLFEVKQDGFRALAFVEGGRCRLVSRNGYRFGEFKELEASVAQALHGRTAILDGEIVCLHGKGRSVVRRADAAVAHPVLLRVTWCGLTARTCDSSIN